MADRFVPLLYVTHFHTQFFKSKSCLVQHIPVYLLWQFQLTYITLHPTKMVRFTATLCLEYIAPVIFICTQILVENTTIARALNVSIKKR